ncbi:hypothetical protein HNQ93_000101 [Hymenobacter luteus]|uniref:Uncharacterized protein n=2 Tax=Hymenobacter TaxID=89966 RepID=A0A7W9SWR0_9BACT|nr:hypothetical protein [Hymenobacter latericoloratus]MBB6057271.1 hypothetical protein [Hymenobacter luteus]
MRYAVASHVAHLRELGRHKINESFNNRNSGFI